MGDRFLIVLNTISLCTVKLVL